MGFRYFRRILVLDLLISLGYIAIICSGGKNETDVCSQSRRLLRHFKTNVTRTVINCGFHRDLHIRVSVADSGEGESSKRACRILLKETLPKDIYVDPFQLSDLRLMEMLYLHNDGEIDVEKIADDSKLLPVNIYFNVSGVKTSSSTMNFTLPLHFRYQKPDWNSSYVDVRLENAQIHVRCDGIKLSAKCGYELVTDICIPGQQRKCSWLKLKEIEEKPVLYFKIPRGNLNDSTLVMAITFIVIVWGSFYVGWHAFKQPDRTKKLK